MHVCAFALLLVAVVLGAPVSSTSLLDANFPTVSALPGGTTAYSSELWDELVLTEQYNQLLACFDLNTTRLEAGTGLGSFDCTYGYCNTCLRGDVEVLYRFEPTSDHYSGTGIIVANHPDKTLWSIFRGTVTAQDAETDKALALMDYTPLSDPAANGFPACDGCQVHTGFYKLVTDNLNSYYFPKIAEYHRQYPDYKMHVTGHSLGGALALLVGTELQVQGFAPTVVALAPPKVGNPEYALWVNTIFDVKAADLGIADGTTTLFGNTVVVVIHKNDVVPMLPPGNYALQGLEFYINKAALPHTQAVTEYFGLWKNFAWLLVDTTADTTTAHLEYIYDVAVCPLLAK